jgi:hypothetical protein
MIMPKHTTVILPQDLQKLKNELSGIYGLKNIISAGLLLFSRLSSDDQKKVISEINTDELVICDTKVVFVTKEESEQLRRFREEMKAPPKRKKFKTA